jgi:hypothetical protein
LSTLQTLAAASGTDLDVPSPGADVTPAPAAPIIHVALADSACRQRVATTLARFGWTAIEHASAAALLTSLQADPTPPALVVVDAHDAGPVRAFGADLPLLIVRTSDVEIVGIGEDDHTRIAAADGLARALIDVAGRLRAAAQPARPAAAPLLRSAPRAMPANAPASSREAS